MKIIILCSILCLLTSACSEDNSNTPGQILPGSFQNPDQPRSPEASCSYGYSEGPTAPVILPSENKQLTYFGKSLDLNLLSAILNVSGSETVRFAELTGVRFYKTNYFAQNSCSYAISLPQAPSDILSVFNQGGKNVLGLYLPLKSQNLVSLQNEAAIQVRTDSDRWTLTHEYMHHLFSDDSSDIGLTDDEVNAQLNRRMDLYQQKMKFAERTLKTEDYIQAAVYLSLSNKALVEFLQRFYLEEMTIESILIQKYDNGEFKLVAKSQRENGVNYVLHSAQKAYKFIDLLNAEISKARHALKLSLDKGALSALASFRSDERKYLDIMAEMKTLEDKAAGSVKANSLKSNLYSMSIVHEARLSKAGCSHSHAADKIFERIKSKK